MGNFRSRSGCLTCRARRVKCDETRPVCKACSKKNRPCQWDAPQIKFKEYQPEGSSAQPTTACPSKTEVESGGAMDFEGSETSQQSRTFSPTGFDTRRSSQADFRSGLRSASISQSSDSPLFLTSGSRSQSAESVPVGGLSRPQIPDRTLSRSHEPVGLTHDTALLIHHYTEVLGRWLDCTDATRQFTMGVPEKIKECPILFHAVLSFAARHKGDETVAQGYYHYCIALLIDRLDEVAASHDETLLCAIVILRFYEQLSVPATTGSDAEQHLAGTSAILRASQGHHFLDPTAPTLREAAFWVYVRQCLYNSTINQQPPDIDFSLQLHPKPSSLHDSHPLARLRLETAWANQMTWHLACIIDFCFDGMDSDRNQRVQKWQRLWEEVQEWLRLRPRGFDPIWQGGQSENQPFPSIWFTADWHAISFGFFHFACILLLMYKPGPKFAIRNMKRRSDTDLQVLEHALLICGASQSSPATVPLNITLCHTVFIWGPLVQSRREQEGLVKILISFEANHMWPTTWIVTALREQWTVE